MCQVAFLKKMIILADNFIPGKARPDGCIIILYEIFHGKRFVLTNNCRNFRIIGKVNSIFFENTFVKWIGMRCNKCTCGHCFQ